ncbi:MAG: redoxin domain-containing protein, partial [Pseudomonadota bacterium]
MRTNIIIIAVCIVLGFAATYTLDFQDAPRSASLQDVTNTQNFPKAPQVTFRRLDGKNIELEDFEGQLVMLNFWATWCAPCKVEFPQMLELANDDKDIIFLAVSVDAAAEDIDRFLRTQDQEHMQHRDVI